MSLDIRRGVNRRVLNVALLCLGAVVACDRVEPGLSPPTSKSRGDATLGEVESLPDTKITQDTGVAEATETSLVEAIRGGETPEGAEAAFVKAVRRSVDLGGRFEFDDAGNLTGLDLAGDRLDRKMPTVEDVALLIALPSLKKLGLYGEQITNAAMQPIGSMAGIVDLALQGTQINDEGFAELKHLTELRQLDLRQNIHLSDKTLILLQDTPRLTHLELLQNSITNAGLASLKRLTDLRMLDLRGCSQISDDGLVHLAELPKLANVRVSGYGITDSGVKSLGQFPALVSLTIEDAGVTDDGLGHLSDLSLEELTVSRCFGVTDEGLRHLADFDSLKRLSLRDTALVGTGLAHVADKRTLTHLNLSQTMLGDAALESIQSLENLVRVELRQTQVGDQGLAILGKLPQLQYLDVANSRVTDAGIAQLAATGKLETLILTMNLGVTDASVEQLSGQAALKMIDISQTGVSKDGATRLQNALPECRVVY